MKFLIVRLSALGDVVCSLPAAGFLRSSFPDCEITWVADKRFRAIPELCSAVDRVLDAAEPITDEFDAAFDLQGLFKSGRIVGSLHASRKLGYHWQREGSALFSSAVLPDPSSFHIVDQYVDVVRAFGGQGEAAFGLSPRPSDVEAMRAQVGLDPFVVLNPGAGWASKRWPVESFARVAEELGGRGIRCVAIGGKTAEDMALLSALRLASKAEIVPMTGKTSIAELVALISLAQAHIGGDTGSTHIAAALGIPAIGLYSLTFPARSCPYGQVDNCIHEPSGLSDIAPERVLEMLHKAAPPRQSEGEGRPRG